ncbi:FxSxx-COOH cyclophane-containing RiPP peptide [Streptomyces sp. NBC_00102]|uniref:FxSxx-COOH cyclophane-containing RiPP peptide n=1 Tax=Streptomyces sp. NBC_00102 TaxID=2975652 RepID=UPI00224FBC3B|nr:FxSxx-COOH cyclophane-containing RiPP peptide [Streptomyces sp. NBC_00102]MCX5400538.1 FxSxx-COOH protein [Streptomyces sp. NBC_00102]
MAAEWEVPDLTGLPLDELMTAEDAVFVRALRRVLDQTATGELPISAYQSASQLLDTDDLAGVRDAAPRE